MVNKRETNQDPTRDVAESQVIVATRRVRVVPENQEREAQPTPRAPRRAARGAARARQPRERRVTEADRLFALLEVAIQQRFPEINVPITNSPNIAGNGSVISTAQVEGGINASGGAGQVPVREVVRPEIVEVPTPPPTRPEVPPPTPEPPVQPVPPEPVPPEPPTQEGWLTRLRNRIRRVFAHRNLRNGLGAIILLGAAFGAGMLTQEFLEDEDNGAKGNGFPVGAIGALIGLNTKIIEDLDTIKQDVKDNPENLQTVISELGEIKGQHDQQALDHKSIKDQLDKLWGLHVQPAVPNGVEDDGNGNGQAEQQEDERDQDQGEEENGNNHAEVPQLSGQLTLDQAKELLDKLDGEENGQLAIKISKAEGSAGIDTVDWALGRKLGEVGINNFDPANPAKNGAARWRITNAAIDGRVEDFHWVDDKQTVSVNVDDDFAKALIDANVPLTDYAKEILEKAQEEGQTTTFNINHEENQADPGVADVEGLKMGSDSYDGGKNKVASVAIVDFEDVKVGSAAASQVESVVVDKAPDVEQVHSAAITSVEPSMAKAGPANIVSEELRNVSSEEVKVGRMAQVDRVAELQAVTPAAQGAEIFQELSQMRTPYEPEIWQISLAAMASLAALKKPRFVDDDGEEDDENDILGGILKRLVETRKASRRRVLKFSK